jgi:DNA-binding protein HU-beta
MKETELITELSVRLNWEKQDVEAMLATFGNVIGDALANNDVVSLHGLGQFESKKKAERISVNPANGKRYLIPPKLALVFKPVTPLKIHLKTLDNNE